MVWLATPLPGSVDGKAFETLSAGRPSAQKPISFGFRCPLLGTKIDSFPRNPPTCMEMFEVPHLYPYFLWEVPRGSQMWYHCEVVDRLIHSTGWNSWGDGGRLRENCDVSLACYDLGICSEMSQQIQGMAPDKNRCLLRSSWLINSAESLLAWTWCRIFSWLRRLWSMFFVVDGLPTVSAFLGVSSIFGVGRRWLKARGGSGSATAIAFQVGCNFRAFDSCAEIFTGSEMQLSINHDPFASILQIMGENNRYSSSWVLTQRFESPSARAWYRLDEVSSG